MTLLALPPTARSSIRSSGFGTICAATGSPTRYFVAQRTSPRLRVGLEPVRHRSPPDPLALRGPLGSGFARSVGGVCYQTAARSERHTFLSRKLRIFPESYEAPYKRALHRGNDRARMSLVSAQEFQQILHPNRYSRPHGVDKKLRPSGIISTSAPVLRWRSFAKRSAKFADR